MNCELLLAGNPNVGKTSVFNRLTHSAEHVGNWHGVTVSEKTKTVNYKDKALRITDLPGLYSLTAYSPEEALSVDRIMENDSLIVNVCEVNNLSRNLYLTLQLLEAGKRVLLAVNMVDELTAKGLAIDCVKLSARLGVPVVATSAKYGKSAFEILSAADKCLLSGTRPACRLNYLEKLPLKNIEKTIGNAAVAAGISAKWAAIKIAEKDEAVIKRLNLSAADIRAIDRAGDIHADLVKARYDFIDALLDGIIRPACNDSAAGKKKRGGGKKHGFFSAAADRIALNRYLALPVFLLVMLAIFIVTFGLIGKKLSDLLSAGFDMFIYVPATAALSSAGAPEWITGLIGDGIIKGLSGILVFLPQILLLFFFLALLEDSGYIARVAFMTDGMFGKIGLSGKSAFTLLMGFGCSATAVLTSRGLEDEKMRKKTAIITPFMSCSARMPVYMTICSAFFAGGNWLIIFFLYLSGAVVALFLAAVFQKCIPSMKSGKPTFIMEMPPYRFPTAERVVQILWNNAKVFIIKVGTTIFALNVIVWMLSNFSFTDGYGGTSDSIMKTFSKFIAVIFQPLGFGSWEAVTALLSGLVAKEAVVSSIESMGGAAALFAGATANIDALAFMVYTLLYVPCIATVAALFREVGVKWTILGISLQLSIAYAAAFIVRWIGLLIINKPAAAAAFAIIALLTGVSAVLIIKSGNKCCNSAVCGDCGKLCKKNK